MMVLPSLPRVERLELATVTLPDWHPEAANQTTTPVYGYVIDHPDGAIVFDTGVGFGNEFIDEVYRPEQLHLDDALTAIGIDGSAIAAVVNSHLHFDHCGQNPLLHGSTVPFYTQRSEVAEVRRDPYYTDPAWALPPAEQRREIDGDVEIADGVTILATPGHTPGHQSVVVRSREGCIVLAGQVVWNVEEFVDETATASNVFSDELRRSAVDSIRRLKALRPVAVHFAHCRTHHGDPT